MNMSNTDDNVHTILSRYGDKRTFFKEGSKWFVELHNVMHLRFMAAPECVDRIQGIDPEGGPYISVGDKLSDFCSKCPPVVITKIAAVPDTTATYQLT